MSDDPSPAEQARAHRLSSAWLGSVAPATGFESDAVGYSRHRLLRQADILDPPETVKSLREQVDTEHAAWLSAENALHEANGSVESLRAEMADTRTDLHKANAEIYRLRAAIPVAEAAWGRSNKRQPRVWQKDDPEPPQIVGVLDVEGVQWIRVPSTGRWNPLVALWNSRLWHELLDDYGPLTEML